MFGSVYEAEGAGHVWRAVCDDDDFCVGIFVEALSAEGDIFDVGNGVCVVGSEVDKVLGNGDGHGKDVLDRFVVGMVLCTDEFVYEVAKVCSSVFEGKL